MSDSLSVLDIAWLIYAHRLSLGGYPIGITGTEADVAEGTSDHP